MNTNKLFVHYSDSDDDEYINTLIYKIKVNEQFPVHSLSCTILKRTFKNSKL